MHLVATSVRFGDKWIPLYIGGEKAIFIQMERKACYKFFTELDSTDTLGKEEEEYGERKG